MGHYAAELDCMDPHCMELDCMAPHCMDPDCMELDFMDPQLLLKKLKMNARKGATGATNGKSLLNQRFIAKNTVRHAGDTGRRFEGTKGAGPLRTARLASFPAQTKATPAQTKPTALMASETTGKPLHCIHCGRWHQLKGHPWWQGACGICGEPKNNKDRCSVFSFSY